MENVADVAECLACHKRQGKRSRAPTDRCWLSFQSRPDSCPSGLPLRRSDGQPLKLIAHLDLARQPRIWFHVVGKIEHIFFHRRRFANFFSPRLFDVDMASRTRARAAAFGLDARHTVLDCGLHERRAVLALDGARRAFGIDEGDLGHGRPAKGVEGPEEGVSRAAWNRTYLLACASRRQCGCRNLALPINGRSSRRLAARRSPHLPRASRLLDLPPPRLALLARTPQRRTVPNARPPAQPAMPQCLARNPPPYAPSRP